MKIGFMDCFEESDWGDFKIFGFASDQALFDFDLVLWNVWTLRFDYRKTNFVGFSERQNYLYGEHEFQRIIRDRARRHREIDWLMQAGKTLVVLGPSPLAFTMKLESASTSDTVTYGHGPNHFFDVYSFLPNLISDQLRGCAVAAWGREMELRGAPAYSDFWKPIKELAYYSVYFTSQVGRPFLFAKGTPFPTGTRFKYGNGNLFIIPGTYDDSSDDYPAFVEAAKHLVTVAELSAAGFESQQKAEEIQLLQGDEPVIQTTLVNEDLEYRLRLLKVIRERFNES